VFLRMFSACFLPCVPKLRQKEIPSLKSTAG
jgi:hypothetical protein